MTKDKIKEELRLVTIFYTREVAREMPRFKAIAERYDSLASELEKQAFLELYKLRYHNGYTLYACAKSMSYSERYIERLHKELIEYFITKLQGEQPI